MPSVLFWLNTGLKRMDLFQNNNLLRYNGRAEYTTATGGFISVAVIVIFIILFANMGIKTANREIIYSTETSIFEADPSPLTINPNPSGEFMFSIGIYGFNMSEPTWRLFDISLIQSSFENGVEVSEVAVPLVMCTN